LETRLAIFVASGSLVETTVKRRVLRRQALHNMEAPQVYVEYLRENPAEVHALYQHLLLKVTQFFRDPEAFDALNNRVFPQLLQNRSARAPIRLWVSGCATGEEAYSLAICLVEFLEQAKSNVPIQLFASNINPALIERARRGFYSENIGADVTPQRLQRYFTRTKEGYRINKDIRERCVFATHDLINFPQCLSPKVSGARDARVGVGRS
jgi:two-component system, chemotaxis family, CheB/CheR fusion protein